MVPGEAGGRCSSLEAPGASARQGGPEEDVGPRQMPCGGCRPVGPVCQPPSVATAGESTRIMVNPTGQPEPDMEHVLPTGVPHGSLEPRVHPRGTGGWTRLDDRFNDEVAKLSLNPSNLSRSFLPLADRDQERNYLNSVSRK